MQFLTSASTFRGGQPSPDPSFPSPCLFQTHTHTLTWEAVQPSENQEAGATCRDSLTLYPQPTFAVNDCGNVTTNSLAL